MQPAQATAMGLNWQPELVKNGMPHWWMSSPVRPRPSAKLMPVATALPCVITTPFGRAVVPEV